MERLTSLLLRFCCQVNLHFVLQIHDEYSLYFEDSSYPEGYAPAIRIPQRYVVECRENTGTNARRRSLK